MKMVPSERLCFLGPDYCWNCFALVSSSIKNSACFCYCINREEMLCHESKISFLRSMFDKLMLKNDATYEGIKWDFRRKFCSSLNNKLFFPAQTPTTKKKPTPDNLRKWPKRPYGSLPHDGFWLLLGQKSCYEKCDRTKMGARSPRPI